MCPFPSSDSWELVPDDSANWRNRSVLDRRVCGVCFSRCISFLPLRGSTWKDNQMSIGTWIASRYARELYHLRWLSADSHRNIHSGLPAMWFWFVQRLRWRTSFYVLSIPRSISELAPGCVETPLSCRGLRNFAVWGGYLRQVGWWHQGPRNFVL